MKTKLLFLLALLLSSGIALQAQTTSSFGAKAGLNVSNVWDEEGQDFVADSKAGFAGGIFVSLPIGGFLGVQPELLVSQKGFKASGSLLGNAYTFNRTSTFIDVPLQLQVRPISAITLLAGPQFSFLVKEKDVFESGFFSSEQEEAFENVNIRRNILGFVAGVDFNVTPMVLSAKVGWDFMNNHGDGTSEAPRYKNSWFQLTAGFRI